jgi:type IV secretion system protein VirB9
MYSRFFTLLLVSNAVGSIHAADAPANPPLVPAIPAGDQAVIPNAKGCAQADDCPAPLPARTVSTRARKDNPAKGLMAGVPVSAPTRRALAQSRAWAENPHAMPTLNEGGSVVFTFGESAPTLVCSPLRVCDVALEPGETVQGAPHIGDAVRWKLSPAVSGSDSAGKVTHLIIKPTEAGLDTNLIVPTNRRTYHLRLVSSRSHYVSQIAFTYPENSERTWQPSRFESGAESVPPRRIAELPNLSVDRLFLDFRIETIQGRPAFKPTRVMDDGKHTYLVMNEDLQREQAPVVVAIDAAGKEQMINYRLKGNIFVLDGSFRKLALLSGVGDEQQRIEVSRIEPCKQKGWFGICWDSKDASHG